MRNEAANLNTYRSPRDWQATANRLGPVFGERAARYDETGSFVTENYADLAKHDFFSAAIPAELGGGSADFETLCNVIRELGNHCGSTALAFAMHTHPVAVNVFKHLRGDRSARETLKWLASGQLIVANTGANDWLESSGTAEPVEGGYRVTARKHFVSGSPGANVLMTSATHEIDEGRTIVHFTVPLATDGVDIVETWNTLGMRATGSHAVMLDGVFVPESAVIAHRPAGEWHPMWEAVIPTALPLITAAYVGLAEAASRLAIESAKRKPKELAGGTGELLNSLTMARLAHADMIRLNANYHFTPSLELTSEILSRKALAAAAVKQTIELAAELVGGPGFFRGHAMERIVRDTRAMDFHPLPLRRQQVFSGRIALGLDPTGTKN